MLSSIIWHCSTVKSLHNYFYQTIYAVKNEIWCWTFYPNLFMPHPLLLQLLAVVLQIIIVNLWSSSIYLRFPWNIKSFITYVAIEYKSFFSLELFKTITQISCWNKMYNPKCLDFQAYQDKNLKGFRCTYNHSHTTQNDPLDCNLIGLSISGI